MKLKVNHFEHLGGNTHMTLKLHSALFSSSYYYNYYYSLPHLVS